MLASSVGLDEAGNEAYQNEQAKKLFREGFSFSGYERDRLSLNLGTKKFFDVSGVSGVNSITDGRGAVFADLDNDGDHDIFLTSIQGTSHLLFRNNVGDQNGFLRIVLTGSESGKDALGAIVRVKTSAGILTKTKSGGSGYLSQHDPRLLFGLGDDSHAEWVEVTWPSGRRQRIDDVPAGRTLQIVEGEAAPTAIVVESTALPNPLSAEEAFLAKLKVGVGLRFPDEDVTALDGRSIQLSEAIPTGRKVLVNLWATYCIPCATEIPQLQNVYGRLRSNQVEIIGLSIDTAGLDVVREYLDQRRVEYPVYVADSRLVERIYATAEVFIPLSFILDERGVIEEIHSGWSKDARESVERLAGTTD